MARTPARRAILAATLACLPLAPGGAADRGTARPGPGRAAFVAYGCAQCHGTEAQGSLNVPALPGYPYAAVLAKLRSKSGAMPRYTARILPDAEVAKIATFLGELKPAKPASTIPLLTR